MINTVAQGVLPICVNTKAPKALFPNLHEAAFSWQDHKQSSALVECKRPIGKIDEPEPSTCVFAINCFEASELWAAPLLLKRDIKRKGFLGWKVRFRFCFSWSVRCSAGQCSEKDDVLKVWSLVHYPNIPTGKERMTGCNAQPLRQQMNAIHKQSKYLLLFQKHSIYQKFCFQRHFLWCGIPPQGNNNENLSW